MKEVFCLKMKLQTFIKLLCKSNFFIPYAAKSVEPAGGQGEWCCEPPAFFGNLFMNHSSNNMRHRVTGVI